MNAYLDLKTDAKATIVTTASTGLWEAARTAYEKEAGIVGITSFDLVRRELHGFTSGSKSF